MTQREYLFNSGSSRGMTHVTGHLRGNIDICLATLTSILFISLLLASNLAIPLTASDFTFSAHSFCWAETPFQ